MKKLQYMFLMAVSCLILASSVMAGDKNKKDGFVFQPTSVLVETVEDVKKKKDDEIVVLQGVIEKSLGGKKYLFRDGTGTIIIKIDEEEVGNVNVVAGETILITGEFDKGGWFSSDNVDVKEIKKVNNK